MKSSIIILIMISLLNKAGAQSHAGMEQYYYFGKTQEASLVSIAYYQNAHNWYGEVRYNYEEKKTVSLYAGKTFNGNNGKLSYTATPVLGLLIGQFNGGSVGLNLDVEYKNFELSSQIQYVFSRKGKEKNFILNWSELSYQVLPFMKSGFALQQTTVSQAALKMEAGFFTRFSYKNWGLPIYIFSAASAERNYVIGINWQWQHEGINKNQAPVPSVKGRRQMAL